MSELRDVHAANLAEKCSSNNQFNKALKRHEEILKDSNRSKVNLYMQICSLYELVIECNYKHSNGVVFEPCVINKTIKMYIKQKSVLESFVDNLHTARKDIVHNMPRLKDSYNKFVCLMNRATRSEFISYMGLCTWNLATDFDFGKFYDLFYVLSKSTLSDELPDIE